jgi:interferon gamma-inducible protein 30
VDHQGCGRDQWHHQLGAVHLCAWLRWHLAPSLPIAHAPPLPFNSPPPTHLQGNARLAPDGTITCQHGPAECDLNLMQNCAVALSTGPEQYIPFIHCLELAGVQQKAKVSQCAAQVKLSLTALTTCWHGQQGRDLVLAAAKATPADHQYVPWATANGVNYCDENGCDAGLTAVCAAYVASGGKAPAACAAAAKPATSNLRRSSTACKSDW